MYHVTSYMTDRIYDRIYERTGIDINDTHAMLIPPSYSSANDLAAVINDTSTNNSATTCSSTTQSNDLV